MKSKTLVMCASLGILSGKLIADPPTIHVAWDELIPPVLGQDYNVSTIQPASLDFPDVELVTGSLTWQIWSIDPDNSLSVGDIGVISCPQPAGGMVHACVAMCICDRCPGRTDYYLRY